jgi:hypothetical protein
MLATGSPPDVESSDDESLEEHDSDDESSESEESDSDDDEDEKKRKRRKARRRRRLPYCPAFAVKELAEVYWGNQYLHLTTGRPQSLAITDPDLAMLHHVDRALQRITTPGASGGNG